MLVAGGRYRHQLEQQLNSAKCIIVLWSTASTQSMNALDEAGYARERGVLVQCRVDEVALPFGFTKDPAISLVGWTGDVEASAFVNLYQAVEQLLRGRRLQPEPIIGREKAARDRERSPAAPAAPTNSTDAKRSIFLCYRRDDTSAETRRLHEDLAAIYGRDAVFIDVDAIPGGADFIDHIDEYLRRCAVMLVVIGSSWSTLVDRKGRRRIALPNDSVKGEIARALRQAIPIIPVLMQDAEMPEAEDLPTEIKSLSRRNAVAVSNQHWRADLERLIESIDRLVRPTR